MTLHTLSRTLGRVIVDLRKSHGCTLVDANGRSYIDLNSQIASLVLGYNHPGLGLSDHTLAVHRTATNLFPSTDHEAQIDRVFPRISPFGDDDAYLWLGSSGSEAIEAAIKHCTHRRKGHCLSFVGGFHGRTCGSLSLTQTNPLYKSGFPSIPTHVAHLPSDNMDEAVREFRATVERRCPAGVFIEPVQCEGGDRHVPGDFARQIRQICAEHDVPFVVDEVQTALGTGSVWAHTHWNLDNPPDMVVFSKKTQTSGLFAKPHLAPSPSHAYAFNSTWAGDAHRAHMLEQILDIIDHESLFIQSTAIGNFLFERLAMMPGVRNVRHIGSFGAFDIQNRDHVVQSLQEAGVIVAGCGTDSIRIRPPLILNLLDVERALERFEHTLNYL